MYLPDLVPSNILLKFRVHKHVYSYTKYDANKNTHEF